jgi:hypothetical protein
VLSPTFSPRWFSDNTRGSEKNNDGFSFFEEMMFIVLNQIAQKFAEHLERPFIESEAELNEGLKKLTSS